MAAQKGHRHVRVHAWGDTAHHAAEAVAEKLRAEPYGFVVTARPDYTAVRINGDGYAVGGGDPYVVWELSWE